MKKLLVVLMLILFITSSVWADDLEDILKYLSGKVMSVQIKLRLLDKDEEITWDA